MYSPLEVASSGETHFTDYARWRLLVSDGGRHTWHYLRTEEECKAWPQKALDKYWLGLDAVRLSLPRLELRRSHAVTGATGFTSCQGRVRGCTEWLRMLQEPAGR